MWKFPGRKIAAYWVECFGFLGTKMVIIYPRRYNGIQITVYACIISMAITRTGEVAILVTCQYLTCGDCGAIVNTKGTSKRPPVNSGKP